MHKIYSIHGYTIHVRKQYVNIDLTDYLFRSDLVKERVNIVSGSFYLPKDNISKPEGDDAHFICEEKQSIGVADGVGGWTDKGVNAGDYARELMINSVNALHTEPKGAVDPRRVLSQAHLNTKLPGSSTACLLSLNGNVCNCVY